MVSFIRSFVRQVNCHHWLGLLVGFPPFMSSRLMPRILAASLAISALATTVPDETVRVLLPHVIRVDYAMTVFVMVCPEV